MNVEFIDNSDAVLEELEEAALRALETCGLIAEGYAVDLAPVAEEYGGTLRGSITHTVDEQKKTAYIGTNVEYAPYQELGTIHMKAQPFLKPAVAAHANEYRKIIENELKNG